MKPEYFTCNFYEKKIHPLFNTNFITLILLLMLAPLPSCRVVQAPEFRQIQQVKLAQLGLSESTLTAQLLYFNPNKFGFKINGFNVDIYINNQLLGKSVSNQKIEVAKMASFIMPVELKVNMQKLPINAWNLITKKKVNIAAKGYVMVGIKGIYKSVPVNYEGEQELDVL
jgi:LEA14-like dessication related protein